MTDAGGRIWPAKAATKSIPNTGQWLRPLERQGNKVCKTRLAQPVNSLAALLPLSNRGVRPCFTQWRVGKKHPELHHFEDETADNSHVTRLGVRPQETGGELRLAMKYVQENVGIHLFKELDSAESECRRTRRTRLVSTFARFSAIFSKRFFALWCQMLQRVIMPALLRGILNLTVSGFIASFGGIKFV